MSVQTDTQESAEQIYENIALEVAEDARTRDGSAPQRANEAALDWIRDNVGIGSDTIDFIAGIFMYAESTPHPSYARLAPDDAEPLTMLAALAATAIAGDILASDVEI